MGHGKILPPSPRTSKESRRHGEGRDVARRRQPKPRGMEPDKECFATGKAHSRAWYFAELPDARRDERDEHNRHNRNQHESPVFHHDGET